CHHPGLWPAARNTPGLSWATEIALVSFPRLLCRLCSGGGHGAMRSLASGPFDAASPTEHQHITALRRGGLFCTPTSARTRCSFRPHSLSPVLLGVMFRKNDRGPQPIADYSLGVVAAPVCGVHRPVPETFVSHHSPSRVVIP